MDWSDVGKIIEKVLPVAGAVLAPVTGGASVLAAGGVSALLKAFSLDENAKPEDLAAAIQNTADPDVKLKLLQAANDFQLKQRDQDLKELQILIGSVHDARNRDLEIRKLGKLNLRADIMLVGAYASIIVIAFLLLNGNLSASTAVGGFLITIGGMFARNIGTAFDFEFGSSRSSMEKTGIISNSTPNSIR